MPIFELQMCASSKLANYKESAQNYFVRGVYKHSRFKQLLSYYLEVKNYTTCFQVIYNCFYVLCFWYELVGVFIF